MFIIFILGLEESKTRVCLQDQIILCYSCISKSLYIENSPSFNSTLSSVSRKLFDWISNVFATHQAYSQICGVGRIGIVMR